MRGTNNWIHLRMRDCRIVSELWSCAEPRFLALRCYLGRRPRFFDKEAHDAYLSWPVAKLKVNAFDNIFLRAEKEHGALFFLHGLMLRNGAMYLMIMIKLVRFVDKRVHPAYFRLPRRS